MEEEETPPFWQPPATLTRRSTRRGPILHSSLVIIIVPSLSLFFIVFILLPSIWITPKPNSPLQNHPKGVSVKKSWDNLNIVLVFFAILCGVFARRNYDVPAPEIQEERVNGGGDGLQRRSKLERRSDSGVPQWGGYAEQRMYSPSSTPVTGISQLRRTVSEMPPAHQQDEWDTGNDRLRFFDDFHINKFYQNNEHQFQWVYPEDNRIDSENNQAEPEDNRSEPEEDGGSEKEILVDTFVLETGGELPSPSLTPPSPPPSVTHAPPPSPPPPPPSVLPPQRTFHAIPRRTHVPHTPPSTPPPPPRRSMPRSRRARGPNLPPPHAENHLRTKQTFHSIRQEERSHNAPPPSPPPPPGPPTPPVSQGGWGEKKKRSSRKRMNTTTKEIATAIASFYNHRKRKRKQKSKPNYEDNHNPSPPPMPESSPQPPTPPPPPPPPPPSVFHSLFRKKSKSKSKKVHSLSSTTSAPPPPLPPRPSNSSRKPPLPNRAVLSHFDGDESLPNGGRQSPLIPPPPPPPPMRLGRYNRVRWASPEVGIEESRSGEMEGGNEGEKRETETESVASVSSSSRGTACPSPDVNAKADTFIARHHQGWRLEKLNSWREKEKPGPTTSGPH